MRRSTGKRVLIPKGQFELNLKKNPYFYSEKTTHTNKTTRYPAYCPGGRTKCSICSHPPAGGQYRRKQAKKDFKFLLKEWKESLDDYEWCDN